MNRDDHEFLQDMVAQLDVTIRRLADEEQGLIARVGTGRVAELQEYWKKELSSDEELLLKAGFDHWDKLLIRTWARFKRVHHTRAEVGRALMTHRSSSHNGK